MNPKLRYFFIIFGIILFIILAPIIVLYVTGTRLSLTDGETRATGIITVRTEPSAARVFLDDVEQDASPATMRFVPQGEYTVRVEKDGYFPWSKRLPVENNKVTYATAGPIAVYLLKQNSPVTAISSTGVQAFTTIENELWYASGKTVVASTISNPEQTSNISIPAEATSITTLHGTNFLLVSGDSFTTLINRSTHVSTPLPKQLASARVITMSGTTVFALVGTDLFAATLPNMQPKLVKSGVLGMTLLHNRVYVVERSSTAHSLTVLEWDGTHLENPQTLMNLPGGIQEADVYVTPRKEVFVRLDTTLYRVNTTLERLADHVTTVMLQNDTNDLSFVTASELWFYNFSRSEAQLLTRTNQPIGSLMTFPLYGYAIASTPQGVMAIEIDNRDHQNAYTLAATTAQPAQFSVDSSMETLVFLNNGQLYMTTIR